MEVAALKIFVASLCPSFIQWPTYSHDATLKSTRIDEIFSNPRILDSEVAFILGHILDYHVQSLSPLLIPFPAITLFGHPRIS